MKILYRGHEIIVKREKCLAGYDLIFYSIFRQSDGFECESSFTDTADAVRTVTKMLKGRIDNELLEEDPWLEKGSR